MLAIILRRHIQRKLSEWKDDHILVISIVMILHHYHNHPFAWSGCDSPSQNQWTLLHGAYRIHTDEVIAGNIRNLRRKLTTILPSPSSY